MPVFEWRGQQIEAPSQEAMKKYITKQHLAGIPEDRVSTDEQKQALLERMKPYIKNIYDVEDAYEIPRHLLKRLLYQESAFLPENISGQNKSSAGAIGIAQFMPATAEEVGIDPLVPEQAIEGAGRYLKSLKDQTGDWVSALAAYNGGPGRLAEKGLARMPKETRNYVEEITLDVPLGDTN